MGCSTDVKFSKLVKLDVDCIMGISFARRFDFSRLVEISCQLASFQTHTAAGMLTFSSILDEPPFARILFAKLKAEA